MHKKPKKKTFLHYCDLDKKKKCKVAPSIWVSLPQRSGFSWKPAFCFLFCRFSSAAFAAVLFYFFFFWPISQSQPSCSLFWFFPTSFCHRPPIFILFNRQLLSFHTLCIDLYIHSREKKTKICLWKKSRSPTLQFNFNNNNSALVCV